MIKEVKDQVKKEITDVQTDFKKDIVEVKAEHQSHKRTGL